MEICVNNCAIDLKRITCNWISRRAFWKVCWPNWDALNTKVTKPTELYTLQKQKIFTSNFHFHTFWVQKKIVHLKTFKGLFCIVRGQYSGISSSFSVSLNFRVKSTSLHSAKIYRDSKSYLKRESVELEFSL